MPLSWWSDGDRGGVSPNCRSGRQAGGMDVQTAAISMRTCTENWLTSTFRGLDATLERLRVDRQLDEALTCGPDPLHLAAVFGLDATAAIRYATAARQLLETAAERNAAG